MLGSFANKVLRPLGLSISKVRSLDKTEFPVEATPQEVEIMQTVLEGDGARLTMVSVDRLWAAICAVKYVVENNIEGDIVECGVWRGGCSIAMALTLKNLNSDKKVILFDTFAGMTAPTQSDRTFKGSLALSKYEALQTEDHNDWCYASIDDVKNNFLRYGCNKNVEFVKGDVLITLDKSKNLPDSISVLRLDTDWYESTKKELEILYPLLQHGGVLLIDDYGHWEGSRKAVDEYFSSRKTTKVLFWKTDYTGRGALKIC